MAKQRLVENVLVSTTLFKRIESPLKEATVENKSYEILGAFRFPFTRPGQKNLNGRIYKYDLWDRLFSKNIVTHSLVNHPEDEGDPARIWAVMKNAGYNKDRTLGMVDCYIINNEFGKTAMGVIAAGGDIGLSSSGVGDFEADGVTVDSSTYELERWADWVENPSYSVFGRIDNERLDTKVTEANMADNKDTKNLNDKLQEKGEQTVKTLTLREKREFEASLKRIFEDVKGIKSFRERLDRAKEALTFYEDVDVDSYKKEFEDLVTEAEKEFEATLKKGEQADAVKKEAEDVSKKAEELKKEAEELKKENDNLKKENDSLKKKIKDSQKIKNEAETVIASMAEFMKRKVPYDNYGELREYAVKATKLYSEMKMERNMLQIHLQELQTKLNSIREAQTLQYQKDMKAKHHIEELRQRSETARILSEERLREAQEAEFMRNVNPDVLDYYNTLVERGESVEGIRQQILSKRTLFEAETFFLKSKKETPLLREVVSDRDLSTPLPVTNYRQVLPDPQIDIPKGFI